MSDRFSGWKQFEQEVAILFQAAGYRIEQNIEYSGQEFDIVATKRGVGDLNNRIAVECKFRTNGSVSNADVQEFVNAFNASSRAHGLTHGILVSNKGFSRQAHEVVFSHPQIKLIPISILENDLLGARSYLEATAKNYKSDFSKYIALSAHSVSQGVKTKNARSNDIANLICERMLLPKPTLTILLGDFGSGKTTIAEKVHSKLSEMFLKEESQIFPLIFYLRTLEQHDSEENYIESYLKMSASEFDINRLEAIKKRNRVNIILDGFDEIASNASEDERMRLFSRAMRISARGHAVMLTSRPSYFNNLGELEELLETLLERDYASVHRLDGQLLRRDLEVQAIIDRQQVIALKKLNSGKFPTFSAEASKIFIIEPLSKEDIVKYLIPYADKIFKLHRKNPEEVYLFLSGVYDLTDLLTRPLLLDMFLDLLLANELRLDQPDMQIGPAGLYHLYINYHLSRDWGVRRFLKPGERLAFARAAAMVMLDSGGSLEASYDSIWKIICDDRNALEGDRRQLLSADREGVVTDVRLCSFMNVTAGGRIEFSHKSFMEYFIAEEIVRQIGDNSPIKALDKILNYEILYFLGSYALVRAETRLEIMQHLQHVSYGQSDIYRTNLMIALIFSEPASMSRNFKGIRYSRIKISKKSFNNCNLSDIRLRSAILSDITFTDCLFENLSIEGKLHDVTISSTAGSLFLSGETTGLKIEECDIIYSDENIKKHDNLAVLEISGIDDGVIRFEDSVWQKSTIYFSSNFILQHSKLQTLVLNISRDRTMRLINCSLGGVIISSKNFIAEAKYLPRINIESSTLKDVTFIMMSMSREHYNIWQSVLSDSRGVIIIKDSDRAFQAFQAKDKEGVTRYAGWAKVKGLLLLSAELYDRLGESTIRAIRETTKDVVEGMLERQMSPKRWSPNNAVSIVQNALKDLAKSHP